MQAEKITKALSIRFPAHLLEQMKEIAKRNHRSLNGEILSAIEEHVKRHKTTG
jgi:predicted transcriptional regulator